MPVRTRALTAIGLAVTAAACGAADDSSEPEATSTTPSGHVTVFAAASLTESFGAVAAAFEAQHEGVDVVTIFAGSSDLVRQIIEGAPADVFASADMATMDRLVASGEAAGEPAVFARNRLEIIVEPGNPLNVTELADLADDELIVAVCAPEVPCGAYTAVMFANAGLTIRPDSLEEHVKAVVSKVTNGEADAGIAYRTDVVTAGDAATGVPIGDAHNLVTEYPVVLTAAAANPVAGRAFVDFLTGPDAQDALARYGFEAP